MSSRAGSSLAKAAFVGISAVNGPAHWNIAPRPAVSTRVTKVDSSESCLAVSNTLVSHRLPPNCSLRWKKTMSISVDGELIRFSKVEIFTLLGNEIVFWHQINLQLFRTLDS